MASNEGNAPNVMPPFIPRETATYAGSILIRLNRASKAANEFFHIVTTIDSSFPQRRTRACITHS